MTEPYGSDSSRPDGRVFYLPPGVEQLELFVGGIAYPNGIVVSPNGKVVYVAEFAKNRIIAAPAIGQTGAQVPHVFYQFNGGFGPDGLAVDSEGNLYVARLEAGMVSIIDPNGFSYGDIILPEGSGTGLSNIALYDGYMYVCESFKSEVWRIKINKQAADTYGLQ